MGNKFLKFAILAVSILAISGLVRNSAVFATGPGDCGLANFYSNPNFPRVTLTAGSSARLGGSITVNWGDGGNSVADITPTIQTVNLLHNYSSAGPYTISAVGNFGGDDIVCTPATTPIVVNDGGGPTACNSGSWSPISSTPHASGGTTFTYTSQYNVAHYFVNGANGDMGVDRTDTVNNPPKSCTTGPNNGDQCSVTVDSAQFVRGDFTVRPPRDDTPWIAGGCRDDVDLYTGSTPTIPSSYQITVYSPPNQISIPSVTGSCLASPNPATTGQNVTWTATASGGTGSYTYSWGGGLSGSGNPITTTYSTPGTYTPTVTITSGAQTTAPISCSALIVNAGSMSSPPSLSCAFDPASILPQTTPYPNQGLKFYALGGDGTVPYNWTFSPAAIAGGSATTYETQLVGGVPYTDTWPSWSSAGTKDVSVTNGVQTKNCSVDVAPAPPTPICTGTPPDPNSSACLGTPAPASNKVAILVSGCSSPKVACEYFCDSGYTNLNGVCVKACTSNFSITPASINPATPGGDTVYASWSFTNGANYQYECSDSGGWQTLNPSGTSVPITASCTPSSGNSCTYSCTVKANSAQTSNPTYGCSSTDGVTLTYPQSQCTGSIPSGAAQCNGNAPASNTPWTGVYSCSSVACQYKCDSGKYLHNGACYANLSCAQDTSSSVYPVYPGNGAKVEATGGTGTYGWTYSPASTNNPTSGSQVWPIWSASGTKTATVTSGGQTENCNVVIAPAPSTPRCTGIPPNSVSCSGPDPGQDTAAILVSTCGFSPSACWYQCGPGYEYSGGICVMKPVCNPGTVKVNSNVAATWTITGPGPNISQVSPVTGATYTPEATGTYVMIPSAVTGYTTPSNQSLTLGCGGSANDPITFNLTYILIPAGLSCSPSSQSVQVGAQANLTATGGTGTYNWTAVGGNPSTGSGSTFGTSYASTGSQTVNLSDGLNSTTCSVNVAVPPGCPAGQNNPHNACSAGSCSSVASCGVTDCSACGGGGCPSGQVNPHSACVSGSCTSVSSCGVSDCGACSGGGGKNPHNECVNNACTSVASLGQDRCGNNADCGGGGPIGGTCDAVNHACVNAAGSANTCSSDPGCAGGAPTHLECQSATCVIAGGAGSGNDPGCDKIGKSCSACTFTASPVLINKGGSSKLTWVCGNGVSGCSINQGIGSVDPYINTNKTVKPTTTTTYTLSCTKSGQTVTATAAVKVLNLQECNPNDPTCKH
jgi:hypothetical protein